MRVADISLRGVRFPEQLGQQTVPWLRISIHRHQGGMNVTPHDAEGERLRANGRHFHWPVPFALQRPVEWSIARARREALRRGVFDVRQSVQPSDRWFTRFAAIALLAVNAWIIAALLAPRAIWLWRSWAGLDSSDRTFELGFLIGASFLFLHLPLIAFMMVLAALRRNVRSLRLTGDGIDAEGFEGTRTHVPWSQVARINCSMTGFAIRTYDGTSLRVGNGDGTFVLAHYAEAINHRTRRASPWRPMILAAALMQVGGFGLAVLAYRGVVSFAVPPWTMYVLIGWGLPLGVLLQALLPRVFRRFAQTQKRRSRRRARLPPPRVSGYLT